LFINNRSFDDSFNLMENYTFSTNRWFETQLNWTSDYLLIKRIGFLQSFLFNESLQVHSLWNLQNNTPYTEAGYSIGLGNLGRIGFFSAFDGVKFKNSGFKISIPLFSSSLNK